jgi:hypothetical protein
VGKT